MEKFIYTNFKYKKGQPVRFKMNGEEMHGLFFKKEKNKITVLLINNTFDKSEKIVINENQLIF